MPDDMDLVQERVLDEQARVMGRAQRAEYTMPPPRGPVYCLGCDERIDPRRLASVPRTLYCVTCQAALERR